MPRHDIHLHSLMLATDIDVLPDSAEVEQHGAQPANFVVVRTPSNPSFHWGNFLVFPDPPEAGDRERWEAIFDREFGTERPSRHISFTWDRIANERGAADTELGDAGYRVEAYVGLIATREELTPHPRANTDVTVRALDVDGDEEAWAQVREIQVEARGPEHEEAAHRDFLVARMADRAARFRAAEGAWYVAETEPGQVVASCGMIVTDGRGRYQEVDTIESHRRLGIASRLVYDAGRDAFDRFGAKRIVIVTEQDNHALYLYESLGFVQREHTVAGAWWPTAKNADRHPTRGAGPVA